MKILITGVSRGLGAALCREYAQQGHSLAGCARSTTAVKNLQDELGNDHHFSAVDLRDDKAVNCLLYTSPSPRDKRQSRMPSSA